MLAPLLLSVSCAPLYKPVEPLQLPTNPLSLSLSLSLSFMMSCDGAPKLERKTVEKNRRIHMRNLMFKLSSLIPKDHKFSKNTLSQLDYIDHTASYIKHMKERIERLKQRRATATGDQINNQDKFSVLKLPMVEVRHRDSSLEVVLISEPKKRLVFHKVVSALEEEGAEVVNASCSVVGDKIFHTIHCQELCSTTGLDASNVYDRLKELIA